MGLNDITFIKGRGGLARPLAGEDHISGFLFESETLPADFGTGKVRQVLDPEDAQKKGIVKGSTDFGAAYYHISEFFRINPNATLYVGIFPASVDFTGIQEMQDFAEGKIRQAAAFTTTALVETQVNALQAIADKCSEGHQPLCILLGADVSAMEDLTTLPDLRALTCPNVSVVIGQDGGAAGAALFTSTGKSVTCVGAALGALSRARVNDNIGWVQQFNMASVELDTPALADGKLVKESASLLSSLNDKGYIFLRKHIGMAGTYFNDSHTCDEITSDYAYIESVRTIDKAIRGIRTYMLPMLNGTVYVDATTGQLTPDTIASLQQMGGRALEEMERAGEISGMEVYINPEQNILATSELEVDIKDVPTGVIRNMKIRIGHVSKI